MWYDVAHGYKFSKLILFVNLFCECFNIIYVLGKAVIIFLVLQLSPLGDVDLLLRCGVVMSKWYENIVCCLQCVRLAFEGAKVEIEWGWGSFSLFCVAK